MNDPDQLFDVAVIGGGINGCGIARDATGRGAKVLLLEAGDLASGTSSASTKLIHGGLRYLEHYEFALVRESLSERERLWAIAPHIAWPMRFVLPHVAGLRPRWLIRLGLFLYDHIGGRKRLPPAQSVDLRQHPAGGPLKSEFAAGFVYSDCWVDDARLVVLNARDAANRGANIRTHQRVTGLTRRGEHWDIATSSGERFAARTIVNAAGPAVLDLLGAAGQPSKRGLRLVRGSHIVVRAMFAHEYSYFFQLPDGRIFFAIPYERDFTLIGTTDQDHRGDLTDVRASAEEIAYLCAGANRFFAQQITPKDVVWTFSGVRPLIDDGSGKPEAATRGYSLDLSPRTDGAAMLSVFGGKITTYRHLAEAAIATLAERLPMLAGPGWTDREALPGGDFPVDGAAALQAKLQRDFPFLARDWAQRLIQSYGTTAAEIFAGAACLSECGQHFGHGLTEREVRYLQAQEWAASADDILWRRTKLGLRFSAEERRCLSDFLSERVLA
jgi:glycerol-3-phosphate dehydrogenase